MLNFVTPSVGLILLFYLNLAANSSLATSGSSLEDEGKGILTGIPLGLEVTFSLVLIASSCADRAPMT